MGRPNFVGTKLINLKDKLPTFQKNQPLQENELQPTSSAEIKTESIAPSEGAVFIQEPKQPETNLKEEIVRNLNPEIRDDKKEKLEKHLLKALKDRKTDYLRTKEVVVRSLNDTIGQLLKSSKELESKLENYNNSTNKLKDILSEINAIDESKWDDRDFSLELADAGKFVEHARIESIICREKHKVEEENDLMPISKNALSPADFFSSSFSQLFKFGFKLFFPLIIGVTIAAVIIALAVLLAMGIL
ncbi:MAG TPA: hypothetical protein DD381_01415 [Lentisphaeria bacterium]|nr:MAG: hypothetical protein A2X47_10615 [Lentisphaerae bacterium GWF2_38_69]HBM15003.1 hypothetical protein [Lentisphaeria bacterium]